MKSDNYLFVSSKIWINFLSKYHVQQNNLDSVVNGIYSCLSLRGQLLDYERNNRTSLMDSSEIALNKLHCKMKCSPVFLWTRETFSDLNINTSRSGYKKSLYYPTVFLTNVTMIIEILFYRIICFIVIYGFLV